MDEKDKQALQHIEDVTNKADEIQRQILTKILSTNAHVEYLQQHGLDGSTDASIFKKLIPLISYQQLKPYIDRIANGDDSSILCANPITEFFISSGTSGGEHKLFPMFEEEFMRRLSFFNYLMPRMKQLIPNILHKDKAMHFHFARVELRTEAGIIAHSTITSLCKRSNLNNTSPNDIILCTDSYQSLYSQLLCGLYQNKIVFRVGALFASTLIHVIKFLENHWTLLANDIRMGTVNPKIANSSVRESVLSILIKPNPELADFIETECNKGTWEGIIPRLWPNTKYINAVATGSMSQYIPLLNYYSNHLPLVSDHYGASECFLGLNLDPLCNPDEISYTLIPTMAYFEFLPIFKTTNGNEEDDQELVDLVDVKLGQEYELVITTYAGLYRYCMGDILRVTGFKNQAPKFSYVGRKNAYLSLDIEKTDEAELHNAVQEAGRVISPFGVTIVDYTSYADSSTIPGHYILYWEIQHSHKEEKISSSIYEDCCLAIEESLSGLYRLGRSQEKCINPLEIKIVKVGTFEKLMEQAIKRGASMSQYKTPRCVNSTQILQLLNSNVVSNYFSQKFPKLDTNPLHPLLFPATS